MLGEHINRGTKGWTYILSFSSRIACFPYDATFYILLCYLCSAIPSAWKYRDHANFPIAPRLNGLNCT